MERVILHCDLNNFYASCECLIDPTLKGKPVAVGGREEERHGVVVAANYEAKKFGVKCGVTTFQAKKLCPEIVIRQPKFEIYNKFSRQVREIYEEYSDRVEPFSIDECYVDITESKNFGTPKQIADRLRERVKSEVGLTISVGVSFNKTFAKIGSDLKKPDATTVITKENFKQVVWPLPIGEMFGVGRKTKEKLLKVGINTIGDLANFDKKYLIKEFGKVGEELSNKANGLDDEEVNLTSFQQAPKSIGNSTTFYKDLSDRKEIELGFCVIAESVVRRMIKNNIKTCKTVSIVVRDSKLKFYQKQCQILPSRSSQEISKTAIKLFFDNFSQISDVRLLGISVSGFDEDGQLSLFPKQEGDIDEVIYQIRNKFGAGSIVRANALTNIKIASALDREQLDKNSKD